MTGSISPCQARASPEERSLRLSKNSRAEAKRVREILGDLDANVLGVVVNGVTGQIAGEYPKSFWKIFGLVVTILVVIGVVVFLAQS